MKQQQVGPFGRAASSGRSWGQRFTAGLLMVITFGLLLLGKADIYLVEKARTLVSDVTGPVLGFFSQPASVVTDTIDYVEGMAELQVEKQRLEKENNRLIQFEREAAHLREENAALRELLNFPSEQASVEISGRVIADKGGSFVHAVLVDVGRQAGVTRDQAVTSGSGLIGRVVEVGRSTSRVLLLTDLNSRVPVLVEPGRWRAVMAGDNTDQPRLLYLPESARITPGARVVTSGHGGVFQPGLPVGAIDSISDSGVRVRLYDDLQRLQYVRLLDYGLRSVLHQERPEQRGTKVETAQRPGR